ncbi:MULTISPECIES: hemerythrin domain-containing protein [unclassified Moritella]|uniref:hemerythrin domain-containing protein n=1 Tax=unclassified Moritella TaxID=2637987 RepID=UPI001BA97FB5|nr:MULTISPECIES: hemerythrin domain-containing protein [unclassified Moritella]QUM86485.1 hemerythrin domain-containing protein [Moritella sp. 28]QUM90710.1 hemerythrin domain-containing protein [Moritella sp. 36]
MLSLIIKDHKQVEQLLNVLTEQLAELESELQGVNFTLMGDIVNYLRNYIERYHHPKEDLIYSYYLEHYVEDAAMPNRLASEHQSLKFLSRELSSSLNMIQLDSVMPFDELAAQLKEFVNKQRAHIQYETNVVMPLMAEKFTPDDWCHIEHLWKNGSLQEVQTFAEFNDTYNQLKQQIVQAGFTCEAEEDLCLV